MGQKKDLEHLGMWACIGSAVIGVAIVVAVWYLSK